MSAFASANGKGECNGTKEVEGHGKGDERPRTVPRSRLRIASRVLEPVVRVVGGNRDARWRERVRRACADRGVAGTGTWEESRVCILRVVGDGS